MVNFNGTFLRQLTWEWTTKGDLTVKTEALIFAAQEQALRTNYVKINIDKSVDSPLSRLCGQKGETISMCNQMVSSEIRE